MKIGPLTLTKVMRRGNGCANKGTQAFCSKTNQSKSLRVKESGLFHAQCRMPMSMSLRADVQPRTSTSERELDIEQMAVESKHCKNGRGKWIPESLSPVTVTLENRGW